MSRRLLFILIKRPAENPKMSGRPQFFTITENGQIFILSKPLEGENALHVMRVSHNPLPAWPAPFSQDLWYLKFKIFFLTNT